MKQIRFELILPEVDDQVSFHYGGGSAKGTVKRIDYRGKFNRAFFIIDVPGWKRPFTADVDQLNGLKRREISRNF